jgi:tetratricopeptide (TPR) repeat protein
LYRLVFPAILAAALAAGTPLSAAPAELGQLDASPTLFTVMAAINAAGYDADLASPNNHFLRMAIREEIQKRNPPSLAAIKEFVARHRRRNDTLELSQYISFALTAGPPPTFAIQKRDADIPPDVSGMTDLSPLLAAFYKEANIQDLWNRSQRAIDQYVARYHTPVSEAVLQVNLYLRQQTSGFKGRHFQIFLELQGAPNQIQRRSYGEQDTIVITPSAELHTFDVRHAYLHYSLDPLASRYAEILERKKGLGDHARRARALEDSFKEDFLSLASESLIKAVEARLDHKPEAAQDALLDGYILTPYFSEQLAIYEKQAAAMLVYYPQMVGAIDLVKEDARLSKVDFRSEATVRTVKAPPPPAPPPLTGAAKTLDDAEQLYKAKDYDRAKKLYLDVLQQTDQKPMHAAAYYGLARIAVFQKDPETGERLFQKTLELEPDPFVKAWTLVFLGRLSLASGDPEQAAKHFRNALAVQGASDDARKAAQQGVQQSSKP